MNLDIYQENAVKTNKKNVLVASCPGSGKTRTLTERLKFLLNNGIHPSKIFAITYTNAAAQEMRDRVGNSEVFIGTIHSLANRILLLNGIDTSNYLEEEEFDALFELTKNTELEFPEVEHLLVDEFQDICDNEYEFINDVLKPKNFFYCGDSCQSIYSFKGSNYKIFMRVLNDPFTTVYELKNNYRCAKEIIEFADKFLENCYDIYKIESRYNVENRGKVIKTSFSSKKDILNYLKEKNCQDWFILSRTNAEVESIIDILKENNIPCVNFRKSELSLEELKNTVQSDAIKVLTIHSAKGLESKNVIVIGAKPWSTEECRVCYVAATRAKEKLIWVTELSKKKKTNYKMQDWN